MNGQSRVYGSVGAVVAIILSFVPPGAHASSGLRTEGQVRSYMLRDATAFNRTVRRATAAGQLWTRSPLEVALRWTGDVIGDTRNTIIEVARPSAEGGDHAFVMITRDGLLDDSVRGIKDRVDLVRDSGGVWTIARARRAFVCRPRRGSIVYSAATCR